MDPKFELWLSLWLPVVLATAAVWFWSFLSWAVLPIHKRDWRGMAGEEAGLKAIAGLGLEPGHYAFPFCKDEATRKDPAFQAKFKAGPSGTLHIWRMPNMGVNMALSLLLNFASSVLIAYLLAMALPRGASFGQVMQVGGTAGVLAYTFGMLPNHVWFQANKHQWVGTLVDGVVCGLATGAIFAGLWPGQG